MQRVSIYSTSLYSRSDIAEIIRVSTAWRSELIEAMPLVIGNYRYTNMFNHSASEAFSLVPNYNLCEN